MAKPKVAKTTTVTVQAAAESAIFPNGQHQGRTDAEGEFVLELDAGEHHDMFTHPDLLMQSKRSTVTAEQSVRVVFEVQVGRTRGVAGDALGKPRHSRVICFYHRLEQSAFRAF